MRPKTSMEQRNDRLPVKVTGEIRTIRERVDYTREYRMEANRLGLRRVFIDDRDARFLLDCHDLMELGEYATAQGFHLHGLRIAALCSPEWLEVHRQYETVAHNRSIAYRAFTEEAEAEEWLARS